MKTNISKQQPNSPKKKGGVKKRRSIMPKATDLKLDVLCSRLGYQFNQEELLIDALTHRSKQANNNERLEFLGDSILGFVIAAELFVLFPGAKEGQLSRSRSSLVKGETLAEIARDYDIGDYVLLGPGELKSGGFRRASILADTFEAIIGAIYLDNGIGAAQQFIRRAFAEMLQTLSLEDSLKDPKTQLQEYLQARQLPLPSYTVLDIEGIDHQQTFQVECRTECLTQATVGTGVSRRKAEQHAASMALQLIASQNT